MGRKIVIRKVYEPRGYSLVEALLVLGVLSILMLLAVPNLFELFQRYALWVAAYEISNELHKARLMAVAGNTSISLRCRADTGHYQLVDVQGVPVAGEHHLPPRIRFENLPRAEIRFQPRGTAAPAGSVTLVGTVGRGRIIVNLSGRVRLEILGPDP